MSMLSLASLNMERDRHLPQVITVCKQYNFDVVCLQEVPEHLVSYLSSELGEDISFIPMAHWRDKEEKETVTGIAVLVRHGKVVFQTSCCYYCESVAEGEDRFSVIGVRQVANYHIQHVVVEKDGIRYPIGHTHFHWTPNGKPTQLQRRSMLLVMDYVLQNKLIFCGDLNAPRIDQEGKPGPIWAMLAKKLKDTIPTGETSTIDPVLHRVKRLNLVVDGMFTPPQFRAEVSLVSGVSDHRLIAARVFPVL